MTVIKCDHVSCEYNEQEICMAKVITLKREYVDSQYGIGREYLVFQCEQNTDK